MVAGVAIGLAVPPAVNARALPHDRVVVDRWTGEDGIAVSVVEQLVATGCGGCRDAAEHRD